MIGDDERWTALLELAGTLEAAGIAATLTGPAALWAQGVMADWQTASFDAQWDNQEAALALLGIDPADGDGERFRLRRGGLELLLAFPRNTVVAAYPWRIRLERGGQAIWVESLYGFRDSHFAIRAHKAAVSAFLRERQREVARNNQAAWEADTYES
ncbi:MAG TPA: hypothetical protein VGE07_18630, partial [Herpetosiphonaceae bacterium]